MSWGGPLWNGLNALDFETLGFGIIAVFLISWLTSIAYYRFKGYEKEFDKTLGGDCIPSQGFWE